MNDRRRRQGGPGAWGSRLLGLALIGLAALLWVRDQLYVDHTEPGAESVVVEVPAGSSLRDVADHLVDAGVIRGAWTLRAVARIEGGGDRVKAGHYAMTPGAAPAAVFAKLVAGEVSTVRVTVPEGWTMERTAQLVADSLGVDPQRFLEEAREPRPAWRERLQLSPGADLEGYLYPETYRFAWGVEPARILETMIETFLTVFDDSLRARAAEIGLSPHAVMTLASIVEAETSRSDERGKVAAVYLNRLGRGWRLEADPTVAFATGKIGQNLTLRDLEVDSAYNTYRNEGLPPGPINSPGREAIVATLWPEPGFAAMYFVADGDGGHVFSRTWEEHRRAVRRYRQSLRR
jgi:UPF0755 protein